MYRTAALILALVAVVLFPAQLAEEPVRALQKPEVRPAPEAFEAAGASGDVAGPTPDRGDLKIGSFEAPERVPDYEVLEESFDARDGARAGAAPHRHPLAWGGGVRPSPAT